MKYLAWVSFILFLLPVCLTRECEIIRNNLGEIYSNSPRTTSVCWIIEVPQDSYVKINITDLNFKGHSCSVVNLQISILGTNEIYTYCHTNTSREPLTAFSDVKVTFVELRALSTSIRVNFSIENIICAQNGNFRCSPNKCIRQDQVCNGVSDCENGEDEAGCETGIIAVEGIKASRENAVTWLRKQRSASYGWGKNTHRAITALYLAKAANFTGENLEEELMVKQLELQTSVALLRNSTDLITVGELSMFVNALKVTCHNPRAFYGHDLVQILGERASMADPQSPSAYLALCNSNWTFTHSDIERVFKILHKPSMYPFISDVQAVAIMAINCMKKQSPSLTSVLYEETINKFIGSQLSDGSFGNVYTTALVTQALISSGQENNTQWNVTATAHYLMEQLNSSSVDFLSTYLTLPIFSGRSLVDISSVNCSNITRKQGDDTDISDVTNKLGGKMRVKYSLYIGDQKHVIHTMILRIPENSTAYDVMRVAQVADPKYKFLHRDVSGQMYVYNIAGITNDPEAGKFWLLYLENNSNNNNNNDNYEYNYEDQSEEYLYENETLTHYTKSPDKLVLRDGQHLIMWYRTADI